MTTPTMKMTTEIPAQITTPDSVETRIGTLKFFDGFPDDATVVLFRRSLRLTEVHVDRTGHRNNIRQTIWLGTR